MYGFFFMRYSGVNTFSQQEKCCLAAAISRKVRSRPLESGVNEKKLLRAPLVRVMMTAEMQNLGRRVDFSVAMSH